MGSKKKAPPAPDYTALAKEQARLQNEMLQMQTQANRPNQNNPLGSINWSQDPATGQWTQTETWDPRIQGAFDQSLDLQSQQIGQIQDLIGQGGFSGGPAMPSYDKANVQRQDVPQYAGADLSTSGVPTYGGSNVQRGDMPQYDPQTAETYANRFSESLLARVRPEQQNAQSAMATKLRLQGLQPGTEAYDRAYKNLLTSQGDVNAQAQLQGLLAGSNEARAMYQSQLQGQNQDFSQQMEQAGLGLSEYQARMAGQGQEYDQMMGRAGFGLNEYQARLAGQGQDFSQQMEQAGLGLSEYQAGLAGQQQGYNQSLQNYLLPWQTAGLTQGLANNIRTPEFGSFSQAGMGQAPQIMDAAQQQYAQQMQAYNDAAKSKSGKGQSIGSIAGAIGGSFIGMPTLGAAAGGALGGSMFSDPALKYDMEEMSDEECFHLMREMVPVSWKWKGTVMEDSGLNAAEVMKHAPQLVERAERGLLKVNYSKFTAILLGAFRYLAQKEESHGHSTADV